MANPGITFKSTVINGLVMKNQWAPVIVDLQETHAFGVEGVSSVQGALVSRDVDVPIIVQGYGSQKIRDDAILVIEKLSGSEGKLEIRVGGGVVIFSQAANVKLEAVQRGDPGFDATHGYWRVLVFTFKMLASS